VNRSFGIGGRERSRAQVAIELFLGMTLFLLVLYWMNYFVASVRDSDAALLDEEKLVAASLVQVANSACAANSSATVSLPCLRVEGKNVGYSVSVADSASFATTLQIIPEKGGAPWFSETALCNFSANVVKARCGSSEGGAGLACINSSNGVVGFWEGACS